jgi:hypothetical protein
MNGTVIKGVNRGKENEMDRKIRKLSFLGSHFMDFVPEQPSLSLPRQAPFSWKPPSLEN